MNHAFLLTGGNLGDRLENLKAARELIHEQVGTITRASSIYETAAWGLTDQPSFLNQVLQVETDLAAERLLHTILSIELELGRKRLQKMGPRIIDIDIIFYNHEVISTADLTVPHPHLPQRRFVLTPLNELAADYVHPVLDKTVSQLLNECPDDLEVRKFL